MALANKLERSKALLDILSTKKNGHQLLVEGLKKTGQTKALNLITALIRTNSSQHEMEGFQFSGINSKGKVSIMSNFGKHT